MKFPDRQCHWDFTQTNSLSGQTALIVGYGSIGTAAEAQLVPFGVTVERIAQELRDDVLGPDAVPEALARADIVIILAPLTPGTCGIVDAQFRGRMRDHAPRSSTPPRCWPT